MAANIQQSYLTSIVIIIILTLFVGMSCFFTVSEGNKAFVLRLGSIRKNADQTAIQVYNPGLHFIIPFIDRYKIINIKNQSFEVPADRIYTIEQKSVKLDYYVKWKVSSLGEFYLSTNGGNFTVAVNIIRQKIMDSLRNEIGTRNLNDLITGERSDVIKQVKDNAIIAVQNLGIDIIDVRIIRLDLPSEVSRNVYERMRADRQRIATKHRAQGAGKAEEIRADADAQVIVIRSEAQKQAALNIAQGDAAAAQIFIDAYSQDQEFFKLLSNLDIYRKTISKNDTWVLDPQKYQIMEKFLKGLPHTGQTTNQ